MERYTASRISAVVLSLAWVLIALVGLLQTADRTTRGLDGGRCSSSPRSAARADQCALVPLAAQDRRLARDARREPAAVRGRGFALVLLSEEMTLLQVIGGILIGSGILVARRRPPVPASE
jgi:hypothetical protein